MTEYIAEKHFCLCKAFPQYVPEMIELMVAFDGAYQRPVTDMSELRDYVINFAVYSNLAIDKGDEMGIDKRVKELIAQGRVLTANEIEKKYNIKNAQFLLAEYDSALRLVTGTRTKSYLIRDKESDFLFWAQKQTETLARTPYDNLRRAKKYQTATPDMVLKPIKKAPVAPKTYRQPDVWAISDSEMHEVACKMARKRNVVDPDTTLLDMVVATVRKNMKQR